MKRRKKREICTDVNRAQCVYTKEKGENVQFSCFNSRQEVENNQFQSWSGYTSLSVKRCSQPCFVNLQYMYRYQHWAGQTPLIYEKGAGVYFMWILLRTVHGNTFLGTHSMLQSHPKYEGRIMGTIHIHPSSLLTCHVLSTPYHATLCMIHIYQDDHNNNNSQI